ncbi:aminotransferase class I/II-fold pyridoxal phosphate-dependent enzyme [Christiangramia salexigens]|uniref:8-amino-7-oxononanoate synthase n=1 Tax=Christiangramia salexigens TaxID=1913577 RepID=A0A1L3J650_9FLAO|nr:pyridoxal phosphate-dependent aminotransferase family protein [Christiangramia salexigens]APG60583.1 8-amino-7-oxononanoate synthase [Christiangramia salexigens]
MLEIPLKLQKRLDKRNRENSLRSLPENAFNPAIDFFSNDYLGFSKSVEIESEMRKIMEQFKPEHGSTGSRLISGNHSLFKQAEEELEKFHNSDAALIFNSGYDANIGFFSCVPQRNDVVFYDELAHASIRDGLKMSLSRNYNFRHNDLEDLKLKIERLNIDPEISDVYVVTESVFSMDGDSPDLGELIEMAEKLNFRLIIDEAHATGSFANNGEGLLQELSLEKKVFARIHTFGKALGSHGAVVLGATSLKNYLINFSRSFIYTTALPPNAIATIMAGYRLLSKDNSSIMALKDNIDYFKNQLKVNSLESIFIESDSPIQACLIPGNDTVKQIAFKLQVKGYIVKPILSPTVPVGQERLRFCIHSYNSREQISEVLKVLGNFVTNKK